MAFGAFTAGAVAGIAKSRLKYLTKIETVKIDNYVFTLHYRVTLVLLLIFSFLVGSNQYFGESILCIKSTDLIPQPVINQFCWVEGTFTVPKALIDSIQADQRSVAHPGVIKYVDERTPDGHSVEPALEHKYYQWVSLVLFLQGISFYVTRFIWKRWESGRLRTLIQDLNKVILKASSVKANEEQIEKHESFLVNYLFYNRGRYNAYAFRFMVCEILNFVNVVLQMVIINSFLSGEFTTYGFDVLRFPALDPAVRVDPMARVFPKMTKCMFNAYGPSGDVQKYDNLCLLPLNIVNEKIYVFLWFWFLFLAIVSAVAVIYRITVIGFPRSRYVLLRSFNRIVPDHYFHVICDRSSYGDWWLLYLLSVNLDPLHYLDVVRAYSQKLENRSSLEDEKRESNANIAHVDDDVSAEASESA